MAQTNVPSMFFVIVTRDHKPSPPRDVNNMDTGKVVGKFFSPCRPFICTPHPIDALTGESSPSLPSKQVRSHEIEKSR